MVWNGDHNIWEVTQAGFDTFSLGERVGSEIIEKFNNGHKEIVSGLHASPGQTRYFVCTYHPSSKFATTCPLQTTTQTWDLEQGWNWVAMSVQLSGDTKINNVFSSGVFEEGDTILTARSGTVTYFTAHGDWSGGFYPSEVADSITLDACKEAKIKMGNSASIDLTGSIPSSHSFDFLAGWIWTGLPISEDLSVDAFLPTIWEDGDKVLSESDGTLTYGSGSWSGSWTHFKPGHMYKFKKATATQTTYTTTARRRFLRIRRI